MFVKIYYQILFNFKLQSTANLTIQLISKMNSRSLATSANI